MTQKKTEAPPALSPEKERVYDELGGNIAEELKQYPIENLNLLTTSGMTGQRVYNKCTENIYRILKNHPDFQDRFRFNSWRFREEYKDGNRWRDLEDKDSIVFQRKISTMYPQFRSVGKQMVQDAVISACADTNFDAAVEFIRSVEWDTKDRLSTWLSNTYGCPEDEYHAAIGSNFFKGMAKRIIEPGCKFDFVLIIESKQGTAKSTSFTTIAGEDWHLETTMVPDNKDFFMQMAGKLIVEFSEGESLSRADAKKMKSVISTRFDTYRTPYETRPKDIPRRCVFAMTTNQSEYLKDETGNRRFFPVVLKKEFADIEWLKENRMQLFAEALYRVETLKETIYEYPEEAAEAIRNEKMIKTGLEDMIESWLENPVDYQSIPLKIDDDGITVSDVWMYALKGGRDRFPKHEEMRVANALVMLGMERRQVMRNGVRKMRWFRRA